MAADNDWSTPKALAIPKEGYFTLQQGRYGPTYPRTPACHGFTIIAKIKPGTEADIRAYGDTDREDHRRESACARAAPAALPPVGAVRHRLRHVLHVSRHLRYGFRQVHRGRDRAVQGDGRRHHLREARRIPGGLEDERAGLHQVRSRTSVPELPRIRGISRTSRRAKSRRRWR